MPDIQPQIRRVREVLGALVRASGSKLTPIERQIGVSRGYVTRLVLRTLANLDDPRDPPPARRRR